MMEATTPEGDREGRPDRVTKYCAICEGALGEGDLDAVCRECYRKAKAPPERVAGPFELKPEHLFAIEAGRGLASFLGWLASQAMKPAPGGPPKPTLTEEERQKRLQDLRDQLDRTAGPDGWAEF